MLCLHADLAQAWASFGEAKSVVSEVCSLVDVQQVTESKPSYHICTRTS